MASTRSLVGLVLAVGLLAFTVGCPGGSGGQTAHVQGKVTIGGQKSFDGVARPQPVIKNLVPDDKQIGIATQIDGDKSDLNFDL
jgi:hypothetical protein